MEKKLKHVLIMAGGTGGHVFPGLAVADYLKEQGVEVSWMGTPQGLESRLVPEAEAGRIIKKTRPDVVLGMGGFASGPGGLASWLSGTPIIIHEQNAKAGLTNKVLSVIARRVLAGFPNVFPKNGKMITVGNPVRTAIENMPSPSERMKNPGSRYRLLVLGGSLGAKAINDMLPDALASLSAENRPEVIHQTGEKHIEQVKKHYESKGLDIKVTAFIQDMAEAYTWADIVLCRAGALTVSELCAAGVGAVLIPFPYAVDDHQTANASFMEKAGAGICIQQRDLSADKLADVIKVFSIAPEKGRAMAEAAYSLRKPHVTKQIFDILNEVVTKQEI